MEGWSGAGEDGEKMCIVCEGRTWGGGEALHKKTTVAGPWVGMRGCEGRDEQAGYLDENCDGEEEGAVVVEAVGQGRDDQDGDEVHLYVQLASSCSDVGVLSRINVRSRWAPSTRTG